MYIYLELHCRCIAVNIDIFTHIHFRKFEEKAILQGFQFAFLGLLYSLRQHRGYLCFVPIYTDIGKTRKCVQ